MPAPEEEPFEGWWEQATKIVKVWPITEVGKRRCVVESLRGPTQISCAYFRLAACPSAQGSQTGVQEPRKPQVLPGEVPEVLPEGGGEGLSLCAAGGDPGPEGRGKVSHPQEHRQPGPPGTGHGQDQPQQGPVVSPQGAEGPGVATWLPVADEGDTGRREGGGGGGLL